MADNEYGHLSDCSVNNGPAMTPGPCDCKGRLQYCAWDGKEWKSTRYESTLQFAMDVAVARLARADYWIDSEGDAVSLRESADRREWCITLMELVKADLEVKATEVALKAVGF